MANVIQCDVCGNVCKTAESKYLKVNCVTEDNKLGKDCFTKDLCPVCYEKLAKLMNEKTK